MCACARVHMHICVPTLTHSLCMYARACSILLRTRRAQTKAPQTPHTHNTCTTHHTQINKFSISIFVKSKLCVVTAERRATRKRCARRSIERRSRQAQRSAARDHTEHKERSLETLLREFLLLLRLPRWCIIKSNFIKKEKNKRRYELKKHGINVNVLIY